MRGFVLEIYGDTLRDAPARILGRYAACTELLRAVIGHQCGKTIKLAADSEKTLTHAGLVLGESGTAALSQAVYVGDLPFMASVGCSLQPDPNIAERTRRRRLQGDRTFSIVGMTHSLVSSTVLSMLAELLFEPVQPWDAMICTSEAAKSVVKEVFEARRGYLKRRGISAQAPSLQLPVIPLGVDTDAIVPTADEDPDRQAFRSERGIAAEDVAVLYFGRIDPFTKSHPIPMFQALSLAQRKLEGGRQLHLLLVGQTPDAQMRDVVSAAADTFVSGVKVHWIDGSDAELSQGSRCASDIFMSLSDNPQESFGLTPVEAMAAGLPVIASDWNGYRHSVINGETGILVKSHMPSTEGTLGIRISDRHFGLVDPEPKYSGTLAQLVSIDIGAAAEALVTLAQDSDMRREMGKWARHHAVTHFDWCHVVDSYLDLSAELHFIRQAEPGLGVRDPERESALTGVINPFRTYHNYPSELVTTNTRIFLGPNGILRDLDFLLSSEITGFVGNFLLPRKKITDLLKRAESGGVSIGELQTDLFPDFDIDSVLATCMWLSKYGLLSLADETEQ